MTLATFPDPYPDELLYSVWARTSQRVGYPRQRDMLRELFGDGNVIASAPFSSHLRHLVAALPKNTMYTVEGLIQKHTLLPFYAPFLPAPRMVQLMADLTGTGGPRIHTRAGIMASSVPSPARLRYCSHCALEDRAEVGECYWHRVHQIPGVLVCARHVVWLEDSQIPARAAAQRLVFTPASNALSAEPSAHRLRGSHEREVLLTIARAATYLLEHRLLPMGLAALQARYLEALYREGFTTARGRLRMQMLCEAFEATYPEALLRLLHCQIRSGSDHLSQDHWLARLVRKPRGAQHPLHHLLLHDFLGLSVEAMRAIPLGVAPDSSGPATTSGSGAFVAPGRASTPHIPGTLDEPFGPGPWPCWNRASNHYAQPGIARVALEFPARSAGQPIGTFVCLDCGYTYKRTRTHAQLRDRACTADQGAEGEQRTTVVAYGTQWENTLKQLWVNPMLSVNAMARTLGVDPCTVKRHAQRLGLALNRRTTRGHVTLKLSRPLRERHRLADVTKQARMRYRKRWRSLLATRPGISTRGLRRTDGGTYMWLYRHDNAWLQRHLPVLHDVSRPRNRIDWEARDATLANRVRACWAELLSTETRPRRVTLALIGRAIGHLALLQRHLDRLPLTATALAAVCETREAAAARRVQWVVEHCHSAGTIPRRWEVIRRAGVERLVQSPDVAAAITCALQICSGPTHDTGQAHKNQALATTSLVSRLDRNDIRAPDTGSS